MMSDRLIRGRYRIDSILSGGGVARISTARDSLTGESVIAKEAINPDPSSRQAIINEYEFLRLHPHPAIIPAYSFVEEHDRPCIIIPFVDGPDLRRWSGGERSRWKRKSPGAILDKVLTAMLETAGFIHFCGYLYNDFKPDNFLMFENSAPGGEQEIRPVLLDFNLICRRGEHSSRRGTLAYISPEVLKGDPPSTASDLYSLGATIFELLSGHPPYDSSDSDELIKLVTETAPIDYSAVPEDYRDGLAKLLSPHPEDRPSNARAAALALGLGEIFDRLVVERVRDYLAAGPPPFAEALITALKDYLKGMSSKAFLVRGMSYNAGAWNFLTRWLEIDGWEVHRIEARDSDDEISAQLAALERRKAGGYRNKFIMLIDDWQSISENDTKRVTDISGSGKDVPVILGANRWVEVRLPHHLFDPLRDRTSNGATAESLRAFLKKPELELDHHQLSRFTGGDPELIYRILEETVPGWNPGLPDDFPTGEIQVPHGGIVEIDRALERMRSLLTSQERDVMDKLAVWGIRVPLLLMVDLTADEQAIVDRLVESGFLIMEKDSAAFSSGAAAEMFYSRVPERKKSSYHRFWAEAAERRLEDPIERLEMTAFHRGRSDDKAGGYTINMEAAREHLSRGKLAKARGFAQVALELAEDGGGSLTGGLSVSADIARAQGDYAEAREKYLEVLRILRRESDDMLKAQTFKHLGDLYRSLKMALKAISYSKKALQIYTRLSVEQGIADCYNNIGLASWVAEQYHQALESFESAAEINRRLGNYRELARIETNQGIIKDMMGRTGEVRNHFLKALEDVRLAGDNRQEALISNNLGFFMIRQGAFEESRRHLQTALELSERIGYTEEMINSLTNLGLCHLRLGDLMESVECNQRARELAMSFGSKHLAADAELNLTEACILMGNFGLADTVLRSLESGRIYMENGTLKAQMDLLRSKWCCGLGDFAAARSFAASVSAAADASDNKRLKVEADIAAAEAVRISDPELALSGLAITVEQCRMLGHSDLFLSAGLLMSDIYFDSGDQYSAESWIEKILSVPNLPAKIFINASILSAQLLFAGRDMDLAIERLKEMESFADRKGFVLLALRSAVVLGEVFVECRKYGQAEKVYKRAGDYRERVISALPDTVSSESIRREPLMARLAADLTEMSEKSALKI